VTLTTHTNLPRTRSILCNILKFVSESGTFLGLDLGGTNFRVIMIKMTSGEAETTMDNYVIPSDVLCGPVKGVFEFIAGKILEFFQKYKISDVNSPLPLGKKNLF
jgi:hexokinase